MNISLKTAQRLAKAGLLDEVAAVAETAFGAGVEAMRKRALDEIVSEKRTISKGYETTANDALDAVSAGIKGIPASLRDSGDDSDDDIFGDYDRD